MHVVLVGPMGVGKSSVGRGVAEALGRPLRDSDDDLAAERGIRGRELAATEGVDALHAWEADHLLRTLASAEPSVIAAAASVVDDPRAAAALTEPFVVWLRAPAGVLAGRLEGTDHRRALGDDPLARVQELAARRHDGYAAVADATVDSDGTDADGVAAAVAEVLAALPVDVGRPGPEGGLRSRGPAARGMSRLAHRSTRAQSNGGNAVPTRGPRAPRIESRDPRVHPLVDRIGVTAWRLVGIGIVFLAAVWLLSRLWVVVLAIAIATLFSRAMNPAAVWLRRRGLKPALVAAVVLLGFALLMAGIIAALVPAIAAEFEDLGPTIEQSLDDLEDWLVEDSPFDVSRADVQDFRDQADERVSEVFSSTESSSVVNGATVAFEVFTALILSFFTSFFILKDGERFGRWLTTFVPQDHQPLAVRLARRAWWTLGGYLRGAAVLGIVEGVAIGLTVWLAGGTLAVPVAVITFFAAFIPFAGALVAGAIAVLVTLVTGGIGGALIVLVVAVVIQQLDNDLLAPFIYGKGLELHPLVVLFALAGGSALLGPVGALFAVPLSAMVINVVAEVRMARREEAESAEDAIEAAELGDLTDRTDGPPPGPGTAVLDRGTTD